MMRWRFEDVTTSDLYTMVKNPKEMGSINRAQKSESMASWYGPVVRVSRVPATAFDWKFSGRLHSQTEHDDLQDWASRARIVVRDHLNREHLVIPKSFLPTPVPARQNGTRNPWLMDYSFNTLYLGRLS